MFCKNCGKEINDKAKFCQFCGDQPEGTKNEYDDELRKFHYVKRDYDRKALKQEAKDVLKIDNNLLMMIVVILLVGLIGGAVSATFVGVLIVFLLEASMFWVTKNLLINKKVDLNLLYKPLNNFEYGLRIIGASLIVSVIVGLGMILLVVPGIIFGLMYSQTVRIMADDKNIGIAEAMTKSKNMMAGHKWQLFVFYLSFIGHFLLMLITFGLWGLYLGPFYNTASTNYYFYLRGLEKQPLEDVIIV
ncbi:MAG TPA: DUF975 family protein [Bacilli bacterium]|nr:DUF975 family protein [Bacilli bacterium]